ncbi:hypothetical protein F5Y05DRAFT_417973 [Hypoxylon sp. FL0543]|nr:hypothetical protein F5Y05DRAFT_417973 [Hypoxylon sp. FL0543]
MGQNQSAEEKLESGELDVLGARDQPAEELSGFTDDARRTGAALEGRVDNGLEAEPSVESNNGSRRGDDLVSGHTPGGYQGLDGVHSLNIGQPLQRSCELQDAVTITRGQGAGGPCLVLQRPIEQAAAEDAQPQAQKGTWSKPSRTQSPTSGCSTHEQISNFQNNNFADLPSLHLLRSKQPHYPTTTRSAIITTLQKRLGINFDLHKKPLDTIMPPKEKAPRKRAGARPAKKRKRSPSPDSDTDSSSSDDVSGPSTTAKATGKAAGLSGKTTSSFKYGKAAGATTPGKPAGSSKSGKAAGAIAPGKATGSSVSGKAANSSDSDVDEEVFNEIIDEVAGKPKMAGKKRKPKDKASQERCNVRDRLATQSIKEAFFAMMVSLNEHMGDHKELQSEITSRAVVIWMERMDKYMTAKPGPQIREFYEETNLPKAEKILDPFSDEWEEPTKDKKQSKGKGKGGNKAKGGDKAKGKAKESAPKTPTSQKGSKNCPEARTFATEPLLELEKGEESFDDCVERRYKWAYLLYTVAKNEKTNSPRVDLEDHATLLPEYFVDREAANAKLLEITNYDQFDGGIAAVTRRHVYEHTPLKLLKAELTLATGEERVFWVEKHLVDLQKDLTKRERSLKKWSARRPALPHYIVECEFMNRKTTETPQRPAEESREKNGDGNGDDGAGAASAEVVGAFSGEIELDRLPLTTYTDRGLANERAGELFLRHSAVDQAIRGPLDDFWWHNNAVPVHREAERAVAAAGAPDDALYAAEMCTLDMNTRLGFDWIRVGVCMVDDLVGPLNI